MLNKRKHLFIGLARRSTGEATYTITQLSGLTCYYSLTLHIHKELSQVVAAYQGEKIFHDLTRLPFNEIVKAIEQLILGYTDVTFIDLNCFFLESNIRPEQRSDFLSKLELIHNQGINVSFIDYFGSFVITESEYKKRILDAQARLENKIKGIPTISRLGYFLRKFIPERMEMQLIPPLKGPIILKPIPLNKMDFSSENVLYYSNLLNIVPKKREKKMRRTVLFGLSRFFEYTVDKSIINNMCTGIFNELKRVLDIEKVVCIDPFRCIDDSNISKKLEIEVYSWVESDILNKLLDEAYFVGLFVPYGTLGTIALNRGVPFVTFYASESSVVNKNYNNLMKGEPFPGFYALGIWEDEAYFPELADNNPYFKSVIFVDICQENAFEILADELKPEIADDRINLYQHWIVSINNYNFANCLEKLYSYNVLIEKKDMHL